MASCKDGRRLFWAIFPLLAAGFWGCGNQPGGMMGLLGPSFSSDEVAIIRSMSGLDQPPADTTNRVSESSEAVAFGKVLFYDTRLSADGEISCATCHDPRKGFGDGKALSEGLATTKRHAPSLWNMAWNRWFTWDGHVDSLWAQAMGVIEHPDEMGGDRMAVARLVSEAPELRADYERIFGALPAFDDQTRFPAHARPVTADPEHAHNLAWQAMTEADRETVDSVFVNVVKAIGAFERTIVSRRSAFDVFVEGLVEDNAEKRAALSPSAQRGLKLFIGRANCVLCHNGQNFTDREFHNLGLPAEGDTALDYGRLVGVQVLRVDPANAAGPFSDDPEGEAAQRLRFLRLNPGEQTGQFKTPSLRNVAGSAPYMHDGRFATLEEVIAFYNELPGKASVGHREETLVPLGLHGMQISHLVDFLRSLTDDSALDELLPPE